MPIRHPITYISDSGDPGSNPGEITSFSANFILGVHLPFGDAFATACVTTYPVIFYAMHWFTNSGLQIQHLHRDAYSPTQNIVKTDESRRRSKRRTTNQTGEGKQRKRWKDYDKRPEAYWFRMELCKQRRGGWENSCGRGEREKGSGN